MHELLGYRRRISPDDLVARPQPLWETDVASAAADRAALPARAAPEFVLPERARVNCLLAWFSAELASGVLLTNAPDAPDTHWGQLLLPLDREREVDAGEAIAVRVICIPAGPERSEMAWSVRTGTHGWEHHDTRIAGVGAIA